MTLGDRSHPLPEPFQVLATQNPIEQEGTYPLPEAQLDRFMFKVLITYPSKAEELVVLDRMAGLNPVLSVDAVLRPEDLTALQQAVDSINRVAPGKVRLDASGLSDDDRQPNNWPPPPRLRNVRLGTALMVGTLPWRGYGNQVEWREEGRIIVVGGAGSATTPASSVCSIPGRMKVNSSPPTLATVSPSRIASTNSPATC